MNKNQVLAKVRGAFLSASGASREQALNFFKDDIEQLENEEDKQAVISQISILYRG